MQLCFAASFVATWLGASAVEHLGRCDGSQQQVADCKLAPCHDEKCVDCAWEEWTEWSSCSCVALKDRHRTIKIPNTPCGKPCNGTRVETTACQPDCIKPPIDCELEAWSSWTDCTKTCGGGQTSRQRKIKTLPQNAGKPCEGHLSDTKACHVHSCDDTADCVLSAWSEWRECSVTCGGGQQNRKREILVEPKGNGQGCKGALSTVRPCNEQACGTVKDCVWGQWVDWSACSRTCGGGEQTRSRMIEVAPRDGGKLCEALVSGEVGPCNTQSCEEVKDCEFDEWSDWDGCSCTCKGVQNRVRHIKQYPAAGGKACEGNLKELQPCNVDKCDKEVIEQKPKSQPIDCKLSAWGDWQQCSLTCGNGVQHRIRHIVVNPQNGGKPCDRVLHTVRGCIDNPKCTEQTMTTTTTTTTTTTEQDIPTEARAREGAPGVDCTWSNWEDWSACSMSCGGGEQYRRRQIMRMPSGAGAPCKHEPSLEVKACNEHGCTCSDCEWDDWSDWGACGCTGLSERHRAIRKHGAACGTPCTGVKAETKQCAPDCLKDMQDCQFSNWQEWGECSQPCGGGQRDRTRSITQEAKAGGKPCEGVVHNTEPCNIDLCHQPIDCGMDVWSEWSSCTMSCGGGEQYRHRSVLSESAYGGKPCDGDMAVVRACNVGIRCGRSVDCEWDSWANWSACSTSCGGGYKTRDRHIKTAPRLSGKLCDALPKMEVEPCNTQSCNPPAVDAQWDAWSHWGDCSVTCGQGFMVRSRVVQIKGSAHSKRLNGPFQDYKKCTMESCMKSAIDCQFDEWSAFGDCSCSCNGIRERSRRIARFPHGDGKSCQGPVVEVEPCNTSSCAAEHTPKDCEFGDWGEWGTCTAACDGGSYTRERRVLADATAGGQPCHGPMQLVAPCNEHPCHEAVDCKWGGWSDWSDCSVECGGGEHNRFRHILIMTKGEGKPCEAKDTAQTKPCNEHACGVLQYCVWGPWSDWDECSKTCGAGQKTRNRLLTVTTKKSADVFASGIMDDLFSFHGEQMTSAQLVSVFSLGMLFASLMWVAIQPLRPQSRHVDEPLLLSDPVE